MPPEPSGVKKGVPKKYPERAYALDSSMLPPFIIEQIRRREQQQQREQPRLELPLPPVPPRKKKDEDEDDKDRGVVVIDLFG